MHKIVWTEEAVEALDLIVTYIEQFDPDAATRLAKRLIIVADSLSEFPERGRPSARNTREITTLSPYIIRYRVKAERVEIIRIRHSAREALD